MSASTWLLLVQFFLVGVGVPAPVHESYQHDVINGMLCRKMTVYSTSEMLLHCLRLLHNANINRGKFGQYSDPRAPRRKYHHSRS